MIHIFYLLIALDISIITSGANIRPIAMAYRLALRGMSEKNDESGVNTTTTIIESERAAALFKAEFVKNPTLKSDLSLRILNACTTCDRASTINVIVCPPSVLPVAVLPT